MEVTYQTVAKFEWNTWDEFEAGERAVKLAANGLEESYAEGGADIREIGFDFDTEAEAFDLKEHLDVLDFLGITTEVKRYAFPKEA